MTNELKVTGRILQISEATKKRNPSLFRADSHAGLCASESKPDGRGKGETGRVDQNQTGVGFSVEFVVHRSRLLDSGDNDRTALKPLRDRVAAKLGFASDDDPRLEWLYNQIKSPNKGVTVIIWEITKEGLK